MVSAAVAQPPPRIAPAPGWVLVRRFPSQSLGRSMVVAVTRQDVAAARPFSPFDSLLRLSPRGILVWATTFGRGRRDVAPMAWPPRLADMRVDHGWEGQPAPNVQQRLRFGAAGGWDLDVRVYFGTERPDSRLLARAAAELRRMRLPQA